ncbi:MAG: hypothetical protein JWM93_1694 [Frankiales bacterium]|nr:hypothetical protein [Frankiales bacterium]
MKAGVAIFAVLAGLTLLTACGTQQVGSAGGEEIEHGPVSPAPSVQARVSSHAMLGRLRSPQHLDLARMLLSAPPANARVMITMERAVAACDEVNACDKSALIDQIVLAGVSQDGDSSAHPMPIHGTALAYMISQATTCMPKTHGASPVLCTVVNFVDARTGEPLLKISGSPLPPLDVSTANDNRNTRVVGGRPRATRAADELDTEPVIVSP